MTLHFSHIGLTEGLTFTFVSPEGGPSARLWRPRGRRYRAEASARSTKGGAAGAPIQNSRGGLEGRIQQDAGPNLTARSARSGLPDSWSGAREGPEPDAVTTPPRAPEPHDLRRRPSPAGLVPRCEDPGSRGRDRDGELEMGRQRPVLGVDRPVVIGDPDAVAARGDHRLDGQDHPLLEQDARARVAMVG